jgi:lysophospholipase L1-like esterase
MKGKISKIKNMEDELVLPVTTVEAIYMEDGKTLNDEIDNINSSLDDIENEKATRQEVDVERKRIDNINSSLDNNTNEINNLKTHITGGNAMQEHSHINKTVLDKFSEVDNKLLFNGKPIESSNSGVNSGGSINTDFDTEISLPFTALSNAEVQLTFSPNEIVTYDLEVGDLNTVDGWTVTCSVENTFEAVEYKGKKCVHFSKDTTSTQYGTIATVNPNERKLNKSHKYYSRIDLCLISDGGNPNYPKVYGANALSDIDLTKLDTWQSFSAISSPTNDVNMANLRAILDGEAYFTGILVDLTLNSLETKSLEELNAMYENEEFTNNNMGFSCIVRNGNISTTITPFTLFGETKVFNVSMGSTLSIVKNEGYNLPNVVAKIKSTNSNIEIEDVDFIINTRFRGKKAVFEGDSITDNDYLPAYNNKSWASYLQEKLKLGDCYNGAVGGSSISTYNSSGSVVNRIKSTNYPIDTKLFIVFAGTNDWNANVELGTVDSIDETTILGALNVLIDTIQTKCPDATIVIMSPMQRSGSRTAVRTAGTLMDVAKGYEEVCMNWGVNYINTLKEFGFNAYNKTVANKYYCEQNSNELHPNPAGHKRIAVRMAGFISTL